MPKIFISYRRDDSAYPAHAIYDKLVARFGKESVFFDVDTMPMGMDFHKILNDAVAQCEVLLAVIGDRWLNAQDEVGQRRLDNPKDFVRIEIEAALSRNIPVVPVLVDKASVPPAEALPGGLRNLAKRHATEVRADQDFKNHLVRLVRGIEHVVDKSKGCTALQRRTEIAPSDSVGVVANSIGMNFSLINAGAFTMGVPGSERLEDDNDVTQHRVNLTKPFCLSVFPVTQDNFEKVVGDNRSHFKGDDNRPVEKVEWYHAVAFCNMLSEREAIQSYYHIDGEAVGIRGGHGYRLPTEAEWEYACRAETTTKWSFGSDVSMLGEFAWYMDNSDDTTRPVGGKLPNPFGLYDMHGNVWEWCWDRYDNRYYNDSPTKDPMGPREGPHRVIRGGSFLNDAGFLRSAYRSASHPFNRAEIIGFRVARNID